MKQLRQPSQLVAANISTTAGHRIADVDDGDAGREVDQKLSAVTELRLRSLLHGLGG
jgi:hypothetical protein